MSRLSTKVYEVNIHETMKDLPNRRARRKQDYNRVFALLKSDSYARDRRNKVHTMVLEEADAVGKTRTHQQAGYYATIRKKSIGYHRTKCFSAFQPPIFIAL